MGTERDEASNMTLKPARAAYRLWTVEIIDGRVWACIRYENDCLNSSARHFWWRQNYYLFISFWRYCLLGYMPCMGQFIEHLWNMVNRLPAEMKSLLFYQIARKLQIHFRGWSRSRAWLDSVIHTSLWHAYCPAETSSKSAECHRRCIIIFINIKFVPFQHRRRMPDFEIHALQMLQSESFDFTVDVYILLNGDGSV